MYNTFIKNVYLSSQFVRKSEKFYCKILKMWLFWRLFYLVNGYRMCMSAKKNLNLTKYISLKNTFSIVLLEHNTKNTVCILIIIALLLWEFPLQKNTKEWNQQKENKL